MMQEQQFLLNTSWCTQCTVRPNKLKYWCLKQRKIYCRAKPGKGFPGQLSCEESACTAGDPGSIPGLGRSPGERIGYPLQYFQASLVAQMVKNPPAMWETWVQSLGWGDSPGEEHGNPLQYFCLENPHGQRSLVGQNPWGCKKSDTLSD